MKKTLIILLLGIFPMLLFSQNPFEPNLKSSIRILNIHKTSLDKLSPFEENELENIIRLNRKVAEKLVSLPSDKSFIDFPKNDIPFFTIQSTDKNLAIFSWEENMGGTYRPFINIFFWKNTNGEFQVKESEEEASFYKIHEVKNKIGENLYLLIGSGIECSTCYFEKALLLKFESTDLKEIFSHQINYRANFDMARLSFDETTKVLSYDFLNEDCEGEDEKKKEECWIRGRYKFDGSTFIEVK